MSAAIGLRQAKSVHGLIPPSDIVITSPYVFATLGDGVTVGGNPTTVVLESNLGNGTAAIVGTASAVWASADGFATFDGASNYVKEPHTNLTGLQSALELGEGIIMVWGRFNSANTTSQIVMHSGCADAGRAGFEVRVDGSSNRIRARVRDLTTLYDTSSIASVWANNVDTNFAVVIDNRVGQKKVDFYCNGTLVNASTTLGTCGNAPFGTLANQHFVLGAGWTNSPTGTVNLPYAGKLRRVGVINFGQTMPDTIDTVIQDLDRYQSLPYWSMDGL